MKKLIQYLLFIAFLLWISSCEDMLNLSPISSVSSATMWKTEADAKGAMYGMFDQFRETFNDDYIAWGEFRTNFYGVGPNGFSHWDSKNNMLTAESKATDWGNIYMLINDCNLILKYVPQISFSSEIQKNLVLSNAYFCRAFGYYYIARIWGNAPVLTSGFESDNQENLFPERQNVGLVFDQIRNDIDQAVDIYPSGQYASTSIASKAAIHMLRTDFYLWEAKVNGKVEGLSKAQESVDIVLNDTKYDLIDDYETVFRSENNKELIFTIYFAINEAENQYGSYINERAMVPSAIRNNPVLIGSTGDALPTQEFEDFLRGNSNDSRADINISVYYDAPNMVTFRWINKYIGEWVNEERYFTTDTRIYRFAEALLFKAEIENALDNPAIALQYLNKIAKRAYGIENYYSGSYSKNELDNLILDERLKEFFNEGKSWWDLIRFGQVFTRVETLIGRENEQNILLYPVSRETLNSNTKVNQTEGY